MKLSLEGVSKLYSGKIWGLKDFTLDVGPGILGLLGPNGAGKSTLMRILATITKPTSGTITWNGTNIVRSPNSVCRAGGAAAVGRRQGVGTDCSERRVAGPPPAISDEQHDASQ